MDFRRNMHVGLSRLRQGYVLPYRLSKCYSNSYMRSGGLRRIFARRHFQVFSRTAASQAKHLAAQTLQRHNATTSAQSTAPWARITLTFPLINYSAGGGHLFYARCSRGHIPTSFSCAPNHSYSQKHFWHCTPILHRAGANR